MLEYMPLNLWATLSEGYEGSKGIRKKAWRDWVLSWLRDVCAFCVCECAEERLLHGRGRTRRVERGADGQG